MLIPKPLKFRLNEGFFTPENGKTESFIRRETDDTLPEEGYKLNITADGVQIICKTDKGFFNAEMTLKQLTKLNGGKLPYVEIEDAPKFSYRGYMLDSGRYFFTPEDVFRQIDYLSLYKINVLHLHLSEDQGWRAEIKKYPKLTEVGSRRSRTLMHLREHKGFYTQEDMKKIVAYAHAHNMTVIPEIDIPGHFSAAIAAYPELACFPRKGLKVAENFGVKYEVACIGKEKTIEFIKDVLDELAEIFTDGYFHIGGDEVPSQRWERCPHCRAKREKLGLKSWAEYQAVFMNEIAAHLKKKGKKTIMWNESHITGLNDKSIIWQYWQGGLSEKDIIKEVNSGRTIINSSSNPYYIDLPYSINSLQKVYEFQPAYSEIEDKTQILGIELPLWTELIPDQKQAERMTFPRLIAGAERAWSDGEDFKDFMSRCTLHEKMLKSEGYKMYSPKRHDPKGLYKLADRIWWGRRVLYWGAISNLTNNAKVEKLAKKP